MSVVAHVRGAWDTNAGQHRLQLRTVMALSGRDHVGERSPVPVTGEMELGRQPASAVSEPFVARWEIPFFIGPAGPTTAPLAC